MNMWVRLGLGNGVARHIKDVRDESI
jgi:hypothetical protein